MSKKTRFIPALTTLIAGLIVSVIDIMNKTEVSLMLKHLLAILIIFYVIGLIAKAVVNHALDSVDQNVSIQSPITDIENDNTEEKTSEENTNEEDSEFSE